MPDYQYLDNNIETFKEFLQDGHNWCTEKKTEWAEKKTFTLTQYATTFNLGILAYIGATYQFFGGWLYISAAISSVTSVFLCFWFMWKVATQNINFLQRKTDIIDRTFSKLKHGGFELGKIHYQYEMLEAVTKLRRKEKPWFQFQKIAFGLFMLSILLTLAGTILAF